MFIALIAGLLIPFSDAPRVRDVVQKGRLQGCPQPQHQRGVLEVSRVRLRRRVGHRQSRPARQQAGQGGQ